LRSLIKRVRHARRTRRHDDVGHAGLTHQSPEREERSTDTMLMYGAQ
jgi:hypothetical protein